MLSILMGITDSDSSRKWVSIFHQRPIATLHTEKWLIKFYLFWFKILQYGTYILDDSSE